MMVTQALLLHCSSPNHGRQHPLPTIAPFLGHPSGELSYWFHINFSSRPSFLSFYKRSKQSNADFLNWRQTLLLRSYSTTSCLDTGGRRLDRLHILGTLGGFSPWRTLLLQWSTRSAWVVLRMKNEWMQRRRFILRQVKSVYFSFTGYGRSWTVVCASNIN